MASIQCLEELRTAQGPQEHTQPSPLPQVQRVTVLFSDLQGSTVWYEIIGDRAAYDLVQQHMMLLRSCIAAFQGHLVKTLGDGVMAVFHRPETAIQAATAMQQRTLIFNQTRDVDPPLSIKIGLHYGPVIVHSSDNQVDYFGRTVNLAAHAREESISGDIVLTAELMRQALVTRLCLEDYLLTPFTAWLKGTESPMQLYRLRLPATATMREMEVYP